MDPIPPMPSLALSPASSAVYTDVPVDPASLPMDQPIDPVPAALSDEEMESEPEEDLPMSDDVADTDDEESSHRHVPDTESEGTVAPMDAQSVSPAPAARARSPTPPFLVEHLPRLGGARTIRTPRKRVRFPSAPYASTSRARPHTLASPPQSTPSLDRDILPYRLGYEPSPTPSPIPSSPGSASSAAPIQGVAAPAAAAAPHAPQYGQEHPALVMMMENLHVVETTVIRIEGSLATLPGPDNFDDMERNVQRLDRQLENRDARMFALERRMADQYQDMRIREGADRQEIRNLRDRLQAAEDQLRVMRFR